jgi:hypothetical protein
MLYRLRKAYANRGTGKIVQSFGKVKKALVLIGNEVWKRYPKKQEGKKKIIKDRSKRD